MKLFYSFILMFFLILEFDFGIGMAAKQTKNSKGFGQKTTWNSNNQQTNKGLTHTEGILRDKLQGQYGNQFDQHFTNIANANGRQEKALYRDVLAKTVLDKTAHENGKKGSLNQFVRSYNNNVPPMRDRALVPTQTNVNANFKDNPDFIHSNKKVYAVGQSKDFNSNDFRLTAMPFNDANDNRYPHKLIVDNNRGLTAHAIAGKNPTNIQITNKLENNNEYRGILEAHRNGQPYRMGFDRNTDDDGLRNFMNQRRNRGGVPIGHQVRDSDVYNPLLYSRTMNDPAPIVTPDIFRNSRNQG